MHAAIGQRVKCTVERPTDDDGRATKYRFPDFSRCQVTYLANRLSHNSSPQQLGIGVFGVVNVDFLANVGIE